MYSSSYFVITLNILCLSCFVQGLPLGCRALVVPVSALVEEGWIWVGLIRMLGCGGVVLLVGSHVLGLVVG